MPKVLGFLPTIESQALLYPLLQPLLFLSTLLPSAPPTVIATNSSCQQQAAGRGSSGNGWSRRAWAFRFTMVVPQIAAVTSTGRWCFHITCSFTYLPKLNHELIFRVWTGVPFEIFPSKGGLETFQKGFVLDMGHIQPLWCLLAETFLNCCRFMQLQLSSQIALEKASSVYISNPLPSTRMG